MYNTFDFLHLNPSHSTPSDNATASSISKNDLPAFEDHSKKLESKLTNAGVSVTSVYYNYDLVHEYQFNLGTVYEDGNNYAQMTFDRLLEFLSK
jgi:hypothetical protein